MTGTWYLSSLLLGLVVGGSPEKIEEALPAATETESAGSLTLDEVTQRGEGTSPVLRQAAADIEVTRGKAIQVGLYPNPIASGGSPQWGGSESQFYGQLSQEIVTKGKLKLNRAAASREVTQAELRFVRARFDLLTELRRGFYGTLAGQERVRVLSKLVDVAKRSEEFVRSLEKSGEGTRAELLLIEIERQKAEVGLENSMVMLDATRRQLAASMGIPETPLQGVVGDLRGPIQDFSKIAQDSGLLNDNALVQMAQVEADRARILLQRAVVEPFPNVTVSGGYMMETTFPNNLGLVSVELPIPVWNRNQGNIRAARGSIASSSEAIQATYNRLSSELAASLGRLEAADQQVRRFETSILPKATESLAITQKAYQGGQIGILTLLQAQRSNAEAELGFVSALEAKWTAAAELAGLLQWEAFP